MHRIMCLHMSHFLMKCSPPIERADKKRRLLALNSLWSRGYLRPDVYSEAQSRRFNLHGQASDCALLLLKSGPASILPNTDARSLFVRMGYDRGMLHLAGLWFKGGYHGVTEGFSAAIVPAPAPVADVNTK